jgi:hypothetical protein
MVVSSVSLAGGLLLLAGSLAVRAEAQTTLDAIRIAALPGNRVRLEIVFSAPASKPLTFAIHNPARIALDFPGVRLNLAHKTQAIAVGTARSVTAVEAGGRARVVDRHPGRSEDHRERRSAGSCRSGAWQYLEYRLSTGPGRRKPRQGHFLRPERGRRRAPRGPADPRRVCQHPNS